MILDYPKVEKYKNTLSKFKFLCDGEYPTTSLFERAKSLGMKIIEGLECQKLLTFSTLKSHMIGWPWEKQVEYLNKADLPAPLVEIKMERW